MPSVSLVTADPDLRSAVVAALPPSSGISLYVEWWWEAVEADAILIGLDAAKSCVITFMPGTAVAAVHTGSGLTPDDWEVLRRIGVSVVLDASTGGVQSWLRRELAKAVAR